MTYDEALAFWYARVDFERRAPHAGELKLDRMRELLRRLGDPHDHLPTVHVTGSKGKGSTCAMLASVLKEAGYRTGLFTSPHLSDVRERIQIDGELIGRDELAALLTEMRPAIDAMAAAGDSPTFFEVGTALGFLHFLRRGCAIAVVEVGLGGRFDSTNVVTPLVSVITSVSLDHTQFLGDTVELIAFEKAGIIKPGVPVVSGVTEPGPRAVIERIAKERGCRLVQLGVDVAFARQLGSVGVRTPSRTWEFVPSLRGPHQAANLAVAVAVVEELNRQDFAIDVRAAQRGVNHTVWPGRFEVIATEPRCVLDCAHSVASAEALVATLDEYFAGTTRSLVFAVSADKDVPGILRVLAPHFVHFYLTRYGHNPRAAAPEELAKLLPAGSGRSVHATPADAWVAACADATPQTLVVVAGSVFLAGELRPLLLEAAGSAPSA